MAASSLKRPSAPPRRGSLPDKPPIEGDAVRAWQAHILLLVVLVHALFAQDWCLASNAALVRGADMGTDLTPQDARADRSLLAYDYAAGDQRAIKAARDAAGNERFTVYVYPSLELRRAEYDTDAPGDYTRDATTESVYLLANGVRLARLVDDPNQSGGPPETQGLRVFFELGDHLGSTSAALDKATGELVERSTYQAYGGAESDYRPGRWGDFREDYRFTGKEEDVEVGLVYFGKRFYAPALQRWVSADPLGIHALGGDPNLYAYVMGRALSNVDPLGLDNTAAREAANESHAMKGGPSDQQKWDAAVERDAANRPDEPLASIPDEHGNPAVLYSSGSVMSGTGEDALSTFGQQNATHYAETQAQYKSLQGLQTPPVDPIDFASGPGGFFGRKIGSGIARKVESQAAKTAERAVPKKAAEGAEKVAAREATETAAPKAVAEQAAHTASELPVAETWGNPKTLARHFRDHGADFAAKNPHDYAAQAASFFQRSQVQRLPTKIDADGVIRVYDPKTNTFGAFNPNGTTRTFFKPSRRAAYWNDQAGVAPWSP